MLIKNSQYRTNHSFDRNYSQLHKQSTDCRSGSHGMEKERQFMKYKKITIELQQMLKQQRINNQELRQRLQMMKRRSALREKQFYNVMQKTNPTIHNWVSESTDQATKRAQVLKTFEKIAGNFQSANQSTNNFIQKKYKQNMHKVQQKIASIISVFNQQLTQFKKISNTEKSNIQSIVQQISHLAQKVNNENFRLLQAFNTTKVQNKLLHQEKQLLINQIVHKKKIINQLYLQNKQSKDKLHELANNKNNKQIQQINQMSFKSCIVSQHNNKNQKQEISTFSPIKYRNQSELQSKQILSINLSKNTKSVTKQPQFITQINSKTKQGSSNKKMSRYSKLDNQERASQFLNKSYTAKNRQESNLQSMKVNIKKFKTKNYQLNKIINSYQFLFQEIEQLVREAIKAKQDNTPQKIVDFLLIIEKAIKKVKISTSLFNNNYAKEAVSLQQAQIQT